MESRKLKDLKRALRCIDKLNRLHSKYPEVPNISTPQVVDFELAIEELTETESRNSQGIGNHAPADR